MTSDGEALFRAVCENPADDTPRLVYADWLEESGQSERAEFVRLQCEAWNLCPAYPTIPEARARAAELLRAHGDGWYGQLPAVEGVTWSALFVRGFVDGAQVLVQGDVLVQVSPLFAAAPLRHLTVVSTDTDQLCRLVDHPWLGRLATFRLLPNRAYNAEPQRGLAERLAEAERRFPQTTFLYQWRPGAVNPVDRRRRRGTASTGPS